MNPVPTDNSLNTALRISHYVSEMILEKAWDEANN